ncbi:MAG: DUF531 family protein [Candidatus Thermoplasmatota archaeon]|nr:DUF531 family protein [Candidatus Thermoplasmatota archaeon]
MANPNKGNDASRFRDLRRRAKKNASLEELEDILKNISDPYFRSQSHILIARMSKEQASSRIERALGSADRVNALWRRAELFGELLKLSKELPGNDSYKMLSGIEERILLLPNGKGLSDALQLCSGRLPGNSLPSLLEKALGNRGFEVKDSKSILKAWSRELPGTMSSLREIMGIIRKNDGKHLESQLMGYIHLQLNRSEVKDIPHEPFENAVEAAFCLKKDERLDTVSYLCSISSDRWSMELLYGNISKIESTPERIKMISYLTSAADRSGLKELSETYIEEAVSTMEQLKGGPALNGIQMNLSQNLLRMKREKEALSLMERIRSRTEEKDPIRGFMVKALEKADVQVPEGWGAVQAPREKKEDAVKGKGNVLALYDTYEGAVKEIHVRAIARAAPLCHGFDLDLALIGFPEDDLKALIDRTAKETNIGKGGKYLRELFDMGRIHLVKASKSEPPTDWQILGLPVATTSRPDRNKLMGMKAALERSDNNRICLIMGLGKQGLPKNMLDSAPAHLELTGKKIPLETATAMGIIAYQMFLLDHGTK